MSDTSQIDYQAVLSDLRAKRDKLDAAIAGIETMLGLRNIEATQTEPHHVKHEAHAALGPVAFLGMTIVDATVKYLKHKRQNQRTEDILRALQDGGLVLTSQEPLNTVGSVLNRNFAQGGEVVRVSRGLWGLSSWHPRLKKKPGDSVKNGHGTLGDSGTPGELEPPGDEPTNAPSESGLGPA